MTQDRPAMPVPRSSWMLGTATLPAVTSRSAIPSPKLVATRVQRGLTAREPTSPESGVDGETRSIVSMTTWMHASLYRRAGFTPAWHAKTHGDGGLGGHPDLPGGGTGRDPGGGRTGARRGLHDRRTACPGA